MTTKATLLQERLERVMSLMAEYDQRAEKIQARVRKLHQAIGDYLAGEMGMLGSWFDIEYRKLMKDYEEGKALLQEEVKPD